MNRESGGCFMLRDKIITLNEFEGAALLKQAGIPVIESILIQDHSKAAAAGDRLEFPVVLKICSDAVPHKTEQGGVVLNIRNTAALEKPPAIWKKDFPLFPINSSFRKWPIRAQNSF